MKHIDKLFKEKLYNHEVVVPEGMWEKIAPIAEEESGRAILWFWFAGLLALLLGGFGIYNMIITDNTNPTDPGSLVLENEAPNPSFELVDNSLAKNINTQKETKLSNVRSEPTSVEVEESKIENTETAKPEVKTEATPTQVVETSNPIIAPLNEQDAISAEEDAQLNNNSQTVSSSVKIPSSTTQSISNTVESINTGVGIPANLVITKSYVNSEGSVIKRSNLTKQSGKEDPVYDVILNSEEKDLNAGALLRIIEPIQNIPLPAFQKKLKKKISKTNF